MTISADILTSDEFSSCLHPPEHARHHLHEQKHRHCQHHHRHHHHVRHQQRQKPQHNDQLGYCSQKRQSQQQHHHHHHPDQRQQLQDQYLSGCGEMLRIVQNYTVCVFLAFYLLITGVHSNMTFVVQPTNRSVVEGWTTVLNCTIFNRTGMVQWMKGGFGLGVDRSLPGFDRYSVIGVEQQVFKLHNGIGKGNSNDNIDE